VGRVTQAHAKGQAMTTRRIAGPAVALGLSVLACIASSSAADVAGMAKVPLTRDREAVCRVVVLDGDPKTGDVGTSLAVDKAAGELKTAVQGWTGVNVPVEHKPAAEGVPNGATIVLATLDGLRAAKWQPDSAADLLRSVAASDEQAFACFVSRDDADKAAPRVFVVSRSQRGVFNGAVYLRDCCIDGPKSGLALTLPIDGVLRSPQMSARGSYALGIYGVGPQYTVEMWKHYLDAFAEDGMDRVYFWTSGFFPSKRFPNTFNRDGSAGTKIGDESSLRAIIDHAHAMGLKFYIGSGVFAWTNAAYLADDMPEAGAKGAGGLCPSNAIVRQRTLDSLVEMYDALPNADGMFLEVRDEHGECQCPICQKPIDEHGSKQYGRAEMAFLRELADRVWQNHPQARFSWNIGYAEHKSDVAYYRAVREMNDPRFEWLECRGSWDLPGPGGKRLPLAYFTRQAIHWDLLCDVPIRKLIDVSRRTANEGLFGYVAAFNPGFLTADYYGQELPYPVDRVPFNLTRFVYRELTWEPSLTQDQLFDRIRTRFFGDDPAGRELSVDLCDLHDWIIANAPLLVRYAQDWVGYDTRVRSRPVLSEQIEQGLKETDDAKRATAVRPLRKTVEDLLKVRDEGLPMLRRIGSHLDDAEPRANPKALDTIRGMRRAIEDTRKQFELAVPDPASLGHLQRRLIAAIR
jgi:hypothetical protein